MSVCFCPLGFDLGSRVKTFCVPDCIQQHCVPQVSVCGWIYSVITVAAMVTWCPHYCLCLRKLPFRSPVLTAHNCTVAKTTTPLFIIEE